MPLVIWAHTWGMHTINAHIQIKSLSTWSTSSVLMCVVVLISLACRPGVSMSPPITIDSTANKSSNQKAYLSKVLKGEKMENCFQQLLSRKSKRLGKIKWWNWFWITRKFFFFLPERDLQIAGDDDDGDNMIMMMMMMMMMMMELEKPHQSA